MEVKWEQIGEIKVKNEEWRWNLVWMDDNRKKRLLPSNRVGVSDTLGRGKKKLIQKSIKN